MAEQRHQRGQADPSVDQGGSEGVTKLMWDHPQRGAVRSVQAGGDDSPFEGLAEPVAGGSTAALEEQEVGKTVLVGMGDG